MKKLRASNEYGRTADRRQEMVNLDNKDVYDDFRIALAEKRKEERFKKELAVVNDFNDAIRPLLTVNKAYRIHELVELYNDRSLRFPGLFYTLMLNNSDIFRVEHICSMPTHIQVVSVPKDAVTGYTTRFNNLIQKAKEFMNDTGLRVVLPTEVSEHWIQGLNNTATALKEHGDFAPVKDIKVCGTRRIRPCDFRTMTQMGIKFNKIKTYSAFWIEEK